LTIETFVEIRSAPTRDPSSAPAALGRAWTTDGMPTDPPTSRPTTRPTTPTHTGQRQMP
jgi:hypothetical protein